VSDEETFLRAVCADPDDDTPRLVFADWLQEHGGAADAEWAELIRLQVQLARGAGAERERLVIRERELEPLVRGRWPARLGQATAPQLELSWANWSRGFPLALAGSGRGIREARSAFAGRVPLREFTVRAATDDDLVAITAWPEMQLVRKLGVWTDAGTISERGFVALSESENLWNLERLQIQWVDYTPRGVEAFLDSPHLLQLHSVKIVGRNFSTLPEGVRQRVHGRFGRWDVH
jgi:uncharacterized protein (TIGR02996 family)